MQMPDPGGLGQLVAGIGLGAGGVMWAIKNFLALKHPSNGHGDVTAAIDGLKASVTRDLQELREGVCQDTHDTITRVFLEAELRRLREDRS